MKKRASLLGSLKVGLAGWRHENTTGSKEAEFVD
jgi:hypothetical protein